MIRRLHRGEQEGSVTAGNVQDERAAEFTRYLGTSTFSDLIGAKGNGSGAKVTDSMRSSAATAPYFESPSRWCAVSRKKDADRRSRSACRYRVLRRVRWSGRRAVRIVHGRSSFAARCEVRRKRLRRFGSRADRYRRPPSVASRPKPVMRRVSAPFARHGVFAGVAARPRTRIRSVRAAGPLRATAREEPTGWPNDRPPSRA